MSTIAPSPQQIALYSTAPESFSVACPSVAGSGKTYSAQQVALKLAGTGVCTSFSKSTVTELGQKMPSRFPARSMHGIGKDAISVSGKYKKIDSNKVGSLAKAIINERDLSFNLISPICQLVSQAKTAGITPGRDSGLLADTPENWEALADQFDIHWSPEVYEISHLCLVKSNEIAVKEGIIDFDDMLYIATLWPHRFARYKLIICDEAQDLNHLQHLMLERMLFQGGRIYIFGDPCQAIYAFRGALHDSFDALSSRFSCESYPLTYSFRCPQAVVTEAKRYVPHIEPAPNAPIGEVIHHETLSLRQLPRTVLCRNNAPLVTLGLRCLVSGISAEIAGIDIGKGLIALTKRITKRNVSSPDFVERLHKWAEREIARKPRSKPRIDDKVMALSAIAAANKDLAGIQRHLDQLYVNPGDNSRRPAQIHLSTIHRAKGREWPDVLFLDPQLIPSKWAEQEWELQQEKNLAYVGITRAQTTLHYCDSKSIEA